MEFKKTIPEDWVAVVDENDQFIRWASRQEVHQKHLVHRSIHVLVFDSQNRLVVQQRSANKATYPSYWDVSCSGHVECIDYQSEPNEDLDELYRRVAQRELEEELGVIADLHYIQSFKPVANVHYEQFQLFMAHSDGPFVLQASEVSQVDAISYHEWDTWLQTVSHTNTLKMLSKYMRQHQYWKAES